jgi:hypothetical protein
LHQTRSPGRNLCCIDDIAFLFVAVVVVVIAVLVGVVVIVEVVGTAGYYPSIQDSYVILLCLRLMVSFYLFFS